jgi:hypothetical protein
VVTDLLSLFDNREQAVVIWLLVFVLGALCIHDVRRLVPGLLKTTFSRALLAPFLLTVAYVCGIVVGLSVVGLWSRDFLDVTVFWFFGAGLWMFGSVGLYAADPDLFRRIIRQRVLAGVLLIEFVANFYVFNLAVELLLILGVTFFVLLDAVAPLSMSSLGSRISPRARWPSSASFFSSERPTWRSLTLGALRPQTQ